MLLKDYPEFHRTIEDIIAEVDKVWWLEKVTGSTPSGRKINATTLTTIRIINGKLVEGWGVHTLKTP